MNPRFEVILSILAYSFCSGTLVLLNKLILHSLPYPSLVVCVQLVAALCFIFTAKYTKLLQVDELRWKFIKPYLYYILLFACGVYSNMKSLSGANVETVIVFRSLSPCLVSLLDAFFLGREFPTARSWSGMGIIVFGTYCYASFDTQFQTQGIMAYFWPALYLCIISIEMAYGKRILSSVDLKTLSGPVLYTNILGLPAMLFIAALGHEYTDLRDNLLYTGGTLNLSFSVVLLFAMSCVVGTGIGYSGWWCRDKVSAASYTLIGVMNKCLTILLNVMIWDQHAPAGGIASLMLCLVGGAIYKQAPLRVSVAKQAEHAEPDDEEQITEKLLTDPEGGESVSDK